MTISGDGLSKTVGVLRGVLSGGAVCVSKYSESSRLLSQTFGVLE